MNWMTKAILAGTLVLPFAGTAVRADEPAKPAAVAPAEDHVDRAEREKWFAKLLTNAILNGQYTMGANGQPKMDRYTILKAVKGEGDNWVLTCKIEYKGLGLPIDLTVPVKWAGDTPVISVTNMKIAGFGTFTARVMFYENQYAGTWSAGDHGGLMWGQVQSADKKPMTKPAD